MQLELFALIAFLSFVRRCVALRGADPDATGERRGEELRREDSM